MDIRTLEELSEITSALSTNLIVRQINGMDIRSLKEYGGRCDRPPSACRRPREEMDLSDWS